MSDRLITAVVLLDGTTRASTHDALRRALAAQTRRPDRVMVIAPSDLPDQVHEALEADRAAGRADRILPVSSVLSRAGAVREVLEALAERGRQPGPHDVAVVGFDDSLAAQVVPPGLTSVRQPLEEVAVQVVRLLEDRLALRTSEEQHVILTPELRLRASS